MKQGIQKFGRFLSGMVMPNISAFIAWGIITALFIPTGWLPNAQFAKIVGPMITYVLPGLIGYTGGFMIYKQRGGVVGAIATIGVIAGVEIPMFLGAMAAGPLGGWVIKKFDGWAESRIPRGFEMLVNNFSAGILGTGLALLGFVVIGPASAAINDFLGASVELLVKNGLLPLTSLFVEPAKVLFLNNAINHGVFSPMGIEQVAETGKSIFFLIEANPGPGLGLLIAYMIAGKGMAKSSAPGAAIIHFFGGIHEIYFPYVLMNPLTIFALIGGGAVGVFVNVLFNSGLTAPASPGSIFAILAMCERGSYLGVTLSIILSAVASCLLAMIILKATHAKDGNLDEATSAVEKNKMESKGITLEKPSSIKTIVFACDAGMGSSAMGATTLTKKLQAAGLDLKVQHYAIEDIPEDVQVIVTHTSLQERVKSVRPKAIVFPITNFMGGVEYDKIVDEVKAM